MGERELDVYQGNDWITYRWSVAQAFDTLDHIRELCSAAPEGFTATPDTLASAAGKGAPAAARTDEPESYLEMLSLLLALCDDLAGEVTIVLADLFYLLQTSPSLQWKGFELRLHLEAIRRYSLPNDEVTGITKTTIDSIVALALRMRDLLKQIDQ